MSRWGHLVLTFLVLLGAWHEGVHIFEHTAAASCDAHGHEHAHGDASEAATDEPAQPIAHFAVEHGHELDCAACYLPWSPTADTSRVGTFEPLQRDCKWGAEPRLPLAFSLEGWPPLRGPPVA